MSISKKIAAAALALSVVGVSAGITVIAVITSAVISVILFKKKKEA